MVVKNRQEQVVTAVTEAEATVVTAVMENMVVIQVIADKIKPYF